MPKYEVEYWQYTWRYDMYDIKYIDVIADNEEEAIKKAEDLTKFSKKHSIYQKYEDS
tara:strand:- start:1165 stop:1335 length:171 start_codon:yes stop_codon:yes gene_type:complete